MQTAWQEAVFALYLAEDKIEPEVVQNMRTWPHSGFSVDQSVHLPAGDRAGIERLVQYMTRCPFSLSRLVKATQTGQVIYKAEKDACRAFPDPQHDELARGPKRNFQILDPLACPECGGQMKVVALIEPPQGDVIEKILRHCGLWSPSSPRAPPAGDLRVHDPDGNWGSDSASPEPRELTFVDKATFCATL